MANAAAKVGGGAAAGLTPSVDQVGRIMPWVDQVHFKDYSRARKAFAATGEGDVPYGELIGPCRDAGRTRDLVWTIETHVPTEQPGATRRSLAAVRRLAAG